MRRGQAARALRAVALAHAALVLAQAAFAGRYLGGDAASLRLHERNAELIVTLALVQLVLAVLVWRPGRGPAWPALASLALWLAEIAQISLGYGRVLAVHVPLGVAIFGLTVALATGTWRLTRTGRERPVSGSPEDAETRPAAP
jgi:hypothetical protein